MNAISRLDTNIKKLKGPVLILGAGGFIGFNLLKCLLNRRSDIYGIVRKKNTNWRLKSSPLPGKNIIELDINIEDNIENLVKKIKPRTIFNLAAYGAYSRQKNFRNIYETNFLTTVKLIEILKETGFDAYIQAGSQSEYGLNAKKPKENSELIPNSHYAVSKVADYYAIKYYGKIEKLPVIHLRLYSAYGPWEEPDRLIPILLLKARGLKYPQFVSPEISRDFVFVDDIVFAFILTAVNMEKQIFGEVFNIATGEKTTIKKLAQIVKKMFKIQYGPTFGGMKKKDWDLTEWYGQNKKFANEFGWCPKTNLIDGLAVTAKWQKDIDFNSIANNWQKKSTGKTI